MGRAQVLDVDLVANASTIWRVVVTVKNRNARASTGCCLQHPRNQMRFGVMPLTQLTLGIRARSIEVTQANRLELIDPLIVSRSLPNHNLRTPLRVDRLLWVLFDHRCVLRLAKRGGGGRKDELVYSMRTHCIQQAQRVHDVVAVLLVWVLHRLAHLDKRGKVHDRIKTIGKHSIKRSAVAKVVLYKFTAQHGIAVSAGQIIQGGDAAAQAA